MKTSKKNKIEHDEESDHKSKPSKKVKLNEISSKSSDKSGKKEVETNKKDPKFNYIGDEIIQPYLVQFPQGVPLDIEELKMKALWSNDTEQHIVTADSDLISWEGRLFEEKHQMKHMIGIYNKKTNKLDFIDARSFNMIQTIKDPQFNEMKNHNDLTNREKYENVVDQFGSRRMQKNLTLKKAAVSGEVSANSINESIVSNLKKAGAEENSAMAYPDLPPTLDLKTEDVSKIYDIDEIIDSSTIHIFPTDVLVKNDKELIKNNGFGPVLFEYKKSKIWLNATAEQKARLAQVHMYAIYMAEILQLRFLGKNEKVAEQIKNKNGLSIDPKIIGGILAEFAQRVDGKTVIPDQNKNKMINYVVILMLYLYGWSVKMSILKSLLSMESFEIKKHTARVGCAHKAKSDKESEKKEEYAELTAPLTVEQGIRHNKKIKK